MDDTHHHNPTVAVVAVVVKLRDDVKRLRDSTSDDPAQSDTG